MNKANEVTLLKTDTGKTSVEVKCGITQTGDLQMKSYTIGSAAEEYIGHDDYEYEINVDREWKDTMLLLLIRDRFKRESQFQSWLEEQGILHEIETWP